MREVAAELETVDFIIMFFTVSIRFAPLKNVSFKVRYDRFI